jgi:membrane protein implicated in regulation of membrane protease activity
MWQAGLDWWVATGVLVVLELLTGTFYLLMIAFGMAAGGLAHWGGLELPWQFLIAALVALAGLYIVRRTRLGGGRRSVRGNRDVNLDIGALLEVEQWKEGRARVMYRGAQWDVVLMPGQSEQARWYEIHEFDGNSLILKAKHHHANQTA